MVLLHILIIIAAWIYLYSVLSLQETLYANRTGNTLIGISFAAIMGLLISSIVGIFIHLFFGHSPVIYTITTIVIVLLSLVLFFIGFKSGPGIIARHGKPIGERRDPTVGAIRMVKGKNLDNGWWVPMGYEILEEHTVPLETADGTVDESGRAFWGMFPILIFVMIPIIISLMAHGIAKKARERSFTHRATAVLHPDRIVIAPTNRYSDTQVIGNRSCEVINYVGKIEFRDDCDRVYRAERDKDGKLLYLLDEAGRDWSKEKGDGDAGTSICFNVLRFKSLEDHEMKLTLRIWEKSSICQK